MQGVWKRLRPRVFRYICLVVSVVLSPISTVSATPPEPVIAPVEVDRAAVKDFAEKADALEQDGALREAARLFIRATAELAVDAGSHLRPMTVYLEKAVICYERVSGEIADEERYSFEQEVVESVHPYIHILRGQQESNPNAKRAEVLSVFEKHLATYNELVAARERDEEQRRLRVIEEANIKEEQVERKVDERAEQVARRSEGVLETEKRYRVGVWTSVGTAGVMGVVALGTLLASRRNGHFATAIQQQLAWDSPGDAMQNATLDVCGLDGKGSTLIQLCRRLKATYATGVTSAVIAGAGAASAITFAILLHHHRKKYGKQTRPGSRRAQLDSIYAGPTPRGLSLGARLRF